MQSNYLNNQILSLSPPHRTLSEIKSIEDLAQTYQSPEIKQALRNLEIEYPKYREIRGDGNCFYRALGISYLKSSPLENFQVIFKDFSRLNLQVCNSIPNQLREFYDMREADFKAMLEGTWKKHFRNRRWKTQLEKQEHLKQVLNSYWVVDFLVILYLRSLNISWLKAHWQEYQTFEELPKDQYLKLVGTYGRQSQGIELQSMPKALSCNMLILAVQKNGVFPLSQSLNPSEHFLFFRPGHYDLLYSKKQCVGTGLLSEYNYQTTPQYPQNTQKEKLIIKQNILRDSQLLQSSRQLTTVQLPYIKPITKNPVKQIETKNKLKSLASTPLAPYKSKNVKQIDLKSIETENELKSLAPTPTTFKPKKLKQVQTKKELNNHTPPYKPKNLTQTFCVIIAIIAIILIYISPEQ